MKGHRWRTCGTTKHLVNMYQTSLKEERKNATMNFTYINRLDLPYYDVDFFGCPNKNFNYLRNDENVNSESCYVFSFELIRTSIYIYLSLSKFMYYSISR